jgi:hypothetical protein
MLLVTENLVIAAETEPLIARQKGFIETETVREPPVVAYWRIFPERTARRPNPKKNMVYETLCRS